MTEPQESMNVSAISAVDAALSSVPRATFSTSVQPMTGEVTLTVTAIGDGAMNTVTRTVNTAMIVGMALALSFGILNARKVELEHQRLMQLQTFQHEERVMEAGYTHEERLREIEADKEVKMAELKLKLIQAIGDVVE